MHNPALHLTFSVATFCYGAAARDVFTDRKALTAALSGQVNSQLYHADEHGTTLAVLLGQRHEQNPCDVMAQTTIPQDTLKQAMKEALAETFSEQRDLFREIVAEALEDFALAEAIEEGRQTEKVSRERIFDTLEGGRA